MTNNKIFSRHILSEYSHRWFGFTDINLGVDGFLWFWFWFWFGWWRLFVKLQFSIDDAIHSNVLKPEINTSYLKDIISYSTKRKRIIEDKIFSTSSSINITSIPMISTIVLKCIEIILLHNDNFRNLLLGTFMAL